MSASNGQENNPASLYHKNELVRARDEIQRIRLCIQRELKLAKKLRIDAEKYKKEVEARARSQASMLLLRARLATKKEIITEFKHTANREIKEEIEQFKRTASEEMQKVVIAEFKRTADEEMQKEITELVSTADKEMQEKITELINMADKKLQKEITELINTTANQRVQKEITELVSTANQRIQGKITELISTADEEMNKIHEVLTDIRKIRLAADKELQTQRRLKAATSIISLVSPSEK